MHYKVSLDELREIKKEFKNRNLASLCVQYEFKAQTCQNGANNHALAQYRQYWKVTKDAISRGTSRAKTLGELESLNEPLYQDYIESLWALRKVFKQTI